MPLLQLAVTLYKRLYSQLESITMGRNDNCMEKELDTWPVRKEEFRNIYCALLVTECNAGKKAPEAGGTASKCHCKLEWIFVEEEG